MILVLYSIFYLYCIVSRADGIYGDYGQFRAIIDSNGLVHWEPGGVFKTVCEIDITYYPFDEQRYVLGYGHNQSVSPCFFMHNR